VSVDPVLVLTVTCSVLLGGLAAGLVSIRRIAAIDPAEAASGRAG
jgi:ABC-type antimicrobial peptide transport system permease subunit